MDDDSEDGEDGEDGEDVNGYSTVREGPWPMINDQRSSINDVECRWIGCYWVRWDGWWL